MSEDLPGNPQILIEDHLGKSERLAARKLLRTPSLSRLVPHSSANDRNVTQMIGGASDKREEAAQQEVHEREEHGTEPPRRKEARSYDSLAEAMIAGFCAVQLSNLPGERHSESHALDGRGDRRGLSQTPPRGASP
jgi:hypothetical protein